MRILHTVEFYEPSVGGAQEVVKQLSERLVKLGHQVTVATTKLPERDFDELNGVKIREFDIHGNLVRGFSGELDNYRRFVLDSDFDVMMNYAAQQWATDLVLPLLDEMKMSKVLVPCGFSGLHDPRYADYYDRMKTWLPKYDRCVYLSEDYRDIDFAHANGVNNGRLIPNGCAADEFERADTVDIRRKLGIPSDHLLILHVGSHTGLKGHAEALKLFHRARLTKATFLLVGNNFGSGCKNKCALMARVDNSDPRSQYRKKRVLLRELTRPETVAAYHQADLFLFPSNIECSPIVLFEAMASRTPFLTTDVGNAREILSWSKGGVLLPTDRSEDGRSHAQVDGSAKVLEELVADPDLRKKLAEAGYAAWKARFTWEAIAAQYEALYLGLIDQGGRTI